MNSPLKIKLNENTFTMKELEAVNRVLWSGKLTMGEQVEEFEREFARYVGAKYAIMVNSGSSANLLAWFALTNPQFFGHRPPWEVIVPAVSWGTTYWPILQAGGKLVFVDSNPETLQMDLEHIGAAINENTLAINPVHVLGNSPNMDTIKNVSRVHGLTVIEDTCEALGAQWHGEYLGTIGDIGTYSFYFSHHISTIEGGMVVTSDFERADRMRMMRSHGWSRASQERKKYEYEVPSLDPNFFFVTTGFNLRPTEINAALGRIQLPKLEGFNYRRNCIAAEWNYRFRDNHFFKPMRWTKGVKQAAFGYPVICTDQITRDDLRVYLNNNGIETRPIVSGNITRHPALRGINYEIAGLGLPGADKITDCGLMWGLHPYLTDSEVEYVALVVDRFRL